MSWTNYPLSEHHFMHQDVLICRNVKCQGSTEGKIKFWDRSQNINVWWRNGGFHQIIWSVISCSTAQIFWMKGFQKLSKRSGRQHIHLPTFLCLTTDFSDSYSFRWRKRLDLGSQLFCIRSMEQAKSWAYPFLIAIFSDFRLLFMAEIADYFLKMLTKCCPFLFPTSATLQDA